jgi:hypothetical protein
MWERLLAARKKAFIKSSVPKAKGDKGLTLINFQMEFSSQQRTTDD